MSTYVRLNELVIDADSLGAFLSSKGWISSAWNGNKAKVYLSPQVDDFGKPIRLLLPNRPDLPDATEILRSAISIASKYFKDSPEQLGLNVFSNCSDIIKKRIPDARPDSIPIELAHRLIMSFASVGYDANQIERRLIDNKKDKLPAFSEMIRFGHTWPGSFGFTLFSPLPLSVQTTLDPGFHAVPFQRKVVERIARAYQTVLKAVEVKDIAPLVEESDTSVSRRLCNSLASMWSARSTLEIESEFKWAPIWEASSDLKQRDPIVLTPEVRPLLIRASEMLLKEEGVRTRQVIRGVVSDLHKNYGQHVKTERDRKKLITIVWEPEPNKIRRVQVELNPGDYQIGVRAHDDEFIVEVEGYVKRKAPFYVLEEPSSLRILGKAGPSDQE